MLTTNLLIICPSLGRPIILKIQSQKKLRKENWESIYRIRKAKQLSTHGGSEKEGGYSWGKKANTLGYSFKKSTKSLTNRDRSIKGLWANLEQFAKICCCVSTWQWPHGHWMHSAEKRHYLYFPMGAWLRIALVTLAHNVTNWPM